MRALGYPHAWTQNSAYTMGVIQMTRTHRPTPVGRRIRQAREDRGWNQSELARRADVTASSLSRVESGDIVVPSSELMAKVARALGVPVDSLMGDAPPPSEHDVAEFRAYVSAMVGSDHADLVEAIVLAAAEKPARDRDVILRVARNVIVTFPTLPPKNHTDS